MSAGGLDADAVRRRMWADRPSPALPLLLLGLVVVGGIVMSLLDRQEFYMFGGTRLAYWAVATLVAYGLMMLIARHQGYRSGIWVSRKALVITGVVALAVVIVALVGDNGWYLPGDLTIRGNLPLLAITAGVLVWAWHERRPGLWALGAILVPLTLLANLYNMENVLFRMGVPYFQTADQVVNLGIVAAVLLITSAAYGLVHLWQRRHVGAMR